MDWRRLQSFKNISKFKSFTEASKELKKSQSSLSRDIIILEKSIGYQIFKRNIRGIELTEQGNKLLKIVDDFNKQIENI